MFLVLPLIANGQEQDFEKDGIAASDYPSVSVFGTEPGSVVERALNKVKQLGDEVVFVNTPDGRFQFRFRFEWEVEKVPDHDLSGVDQFGIPLKVDAQCGPHQLNSAILATNHNMHGLGNLFLDMEFNWEQTYQPVCHSKIVIPCLMLRFETWRTKQFVLGTVLAIGRKVFGECEEHVSSQLG